MPSHLVKWSPTEVETALGAAAGGRETILAACPQRGYQAVMNLVSDVHRLHQGQRPHHLSRPIQQHLAQRRGALHCPRCGRPL